MQSEGIDAHLRGCGWRHLDRTKAMYASTNFAAARFRLDWFFLQFCTRPLYLIMPDGSHLSPALAFRSSETGP